MCVCGEGADTLANENSMDFHIKTQVNGIRKPTVANIQMKQNKQPTKKTKSTNTKKKHTQHSCLAEKALQIKMDSNLIEIQCEKWAPNKTRLDALQKINWSNWIGDKVIVDDQICRFELVFIYSGLCFFALARCSFIVLIL